ncbi:MAG: ZIP family metal transporter [Clostridia bacterium]|nr:ZIP family metal transporter [Clostridia bacterium]
MSFTFINSSIEFSALWLILIAGGAGIFGTGIGGLIGLLFKCSSNRIISCVLNFAAGVMIAVVCFDLIPEAEALTGNSLYITIISVILSAVLTFGLSVLLDKYNKKIDTTIHCENIGKESTGNKEQRLTSVRVKLARAGLIMLLAISLHNFPEGMAIGSIGAVPERYSNAILIAILLALHNIPEGMAITVPLVTGGMKRKKALFLTVSAGAVTILGAIFGYVLGGITPIITAICLASAGGAMLYVTFAEIIPEAMMIYSGKTTALFLLVGVITGMGAIYIGGIV